MTAKAPTPAQPCKCKHEIWEHIGRCRVTNCDCKRFESSEPLVRASYARSDEPSYGLDKESAAVINSILEAKGQEIREPETPCETPQDWEWWFSLTPTERLEWIGKMRASLTSATAGEPPTEKEIDEFIGEHLGDAQTATRIAMRVIGKELIHKWINRAGEPNADIPESKRTATQWHFHECGHGGIGEKPEHCPECDARAESPSTATDKEVLTGLNCGECGHDKVFHFHATAIGSFCKKCSIDNNTWEHTFITPSTAKPEEK